MKMMMVKVVVMMNPMNPMFHLNQLFNYPLLKLKQAKKMKMFSFVNVLNFIDSMPKQIK
jgi:hypothetical protein